MADTDTWVQSKWSESKCCCFVCFDGFRCTLTPRQGSLSGCSDICVLTQADKRKHRRTNWQYGPKYYILIRYNVLGSWNKESDREKWMLMLYHKWIHLLSSLFLMNFNILIVCFCLFLFYSCICKLIFLQTSVSSLRAWRFFICESRQDTVATQPG